MNKSIENYSPTSKYKGEVKYRADCKECNNFKKSREFYKTQKGWALEILSQARKRSSIRGLDFNLVSEDLVIPEHCPVLGIPLFKGEKQKTYNSPTLDRIDPNKGYVKENIRIISWRANKIKSDATLEEIEAIVEYIKENKNNA